MEKENASPTDRTEAKKQLEIWSFQKFQKNKGMKRNYNNINHYTLLLIKKTTFPEKQVQEKFTGYFLQCIISTSKTENKATKII